MENKHQWHHTSDDGEFQCVTSVEGQIVVQEPIGTMNDDGATVAIEHIRNAIENISGLVGLLVDAKSLDHLSPSARRALTDFVTGDDSPIAIISIAGGNFFIRNIFNLFLRVSSIPAKLFSDRSEALSWLEEQLKNASSGRNHG